MKGQDIKIGDKVKLKRECTTAGGVRFEAGRVMTVAGVHYYYYLRDIDTANGIDKVARDAFEKVTAGGSFERFWSAYPRKVGKKAAQKAWDRAKDKPGLEDILKAIGRQKLSQQWTRDGGQFIPHPATWLNQGRWDDGDGVETYTTWDQMVRAVWSDAPPTTLQDVSRLLSNTGDLSKAAESLRKRRIAAEKEQP